MVTFFRTLAWLSLVVLLLPSVLYLAGTFDLPQVKSWMLWSSLVWFGISGGLAYFANSDPADT
ncbi:MAG: hypothetical protein K9N46_02080 [Candidatus Marinimicrobia bacterium]|nr:hypothetical protein [Candidatus Neomarinimicrobiota bacterium]MCF7828314.1 hypothetical protein [Candidatus Neomarinimicrobiota bacterium]MCF7879511.1 hypothetical protein [Candidatus Neomarinimicrobiota bacterium]